MMLLGLIAANFSALAMEPVGHIAGTASAAYGFVTGVVGGIIGAAALLGADPTARLSPQRLTTCSGT